MGQESGEHVPRQLRQPAVRASLTTGIATAAAEGWYCRQGQGSACDPAHQFLTRLGIHVGCRELQQRNCSHGRSAGSRQDKRHAFQKRMYLPAWLPDKHARAHASSHARARITQYPPAAVPPCKCCPTQGLPAKLIRMSILTTGWGGGALTIAQEMICGQSQAIEHVPLDQQRTRQAGWECPSVRDPSGTMQHRLLREQPHSSVAAMAL